MPIPILGIFLLDIYLKAVYNMIIPKTGINKMKEGDFITNTEIMYACIEAERARRHWTIETFAEKIGVSEKTYRNWRDNCKVLKSDVLIKMSKVFDCSVDYLLGLSKTIKNKSA